MAGPMLLLLSVSLSLGCVRVRPDGPTAVEPSGPAPVVEDASAAHLLPLWLGLDVLECGPVECASPLLLEDEAGVLAEAWRQFDGGGVNEVFVGLMPADGDGPTIALDPEGQRELFETDAPIERLGRYGVERVGTVGPGCAADMQIGGGGSPRPGGIKPGEEITEYFEKFPKVERDKSDGICAALTIFHSLYRTLDAIPAEGTPPVLLDPIEIDDPNVVMLDRYVEPMILRDIQSAGGGAGPDDPNRTMDQAQLGVAHSSVPWETKDIGEVFPWTRLDRADPASVTAWCRELHTYVVLGHDCVLWITRPGESGTRKAHVEPVIDVTVGSVGCRVQTVNTLAQDFPKKDFTNIRLDPGYHEWQLGTGAAPFVVDETSVTMTQSKSDGSVYETSALQSTFLLKKYDTAWFGCFGDVTPRPPD